MTLYPDPPFSGASWPLNHHMGVTSPRYLHSMLWAAATYRNSPDPASDINNYLVANKILTPNVRADSGQLDAWRDYQQVLSELGLIYSTEVVRKITPTALGLAYLDGSLSFSDIMTLQAFRFQYPNGHHLQIGPAQRQLLARSPLGAVRTLSQVQHRSGMRIRPAVLVWDVLRGLEALGERPVLSIDEIEAYLVRCTTHSDANACLHALVQARHGGASLPDGDTRKRRNVQDWVKFLRFTSLFVKDSRYGSSIRMSDFGSANAGTIDDMCRVLRADSSFWIPSTLDSRDRSSWYSWLGSVDLSLNLTPSLPRPEEDEYVGGRDEEDEDDRRHVDEIHLRLFSPEGFLTSQGIYEGSGGTLIESSYDSRLVQRAKSLHDQMVLLIYNVCSANGGRVYDDPRSVDLLAEFEGHEVIVEVKSITPRNMVSRTRYAVGQVEHYDFLRSQQSNLPRRKVIAFAARVPDDSWCIPFLTQHVDIDLLSLSDSHLRARTTNPLVQRLFRPVQTAGTPALI